MQRTTPDQLCPEHLPGKKVEISIGKHKGSKAEIKFQNGHGYVTVRRLWADKNDKFYYKNLKLI